MPGNWYLAPEGRRSIAKGVSPWIRRTPPTLSPNGATVALRAEALPPLVSGLGRVSASIQWLTPVAIDARPATAFQTDSHSQSTETERCLTTRQDGQNVSPCGQPNSDV